jgi:hypothetical protein
VYEHYNVHLGHYFYTADIFESLGIDNGAAGEGWVKTGLSFVAFRTTAESHDGYSNTTCDQNPDPCLPVNRFYSGGPNSHFYTSNAAEAEGLKQPGSGWGFEYVGFYLPAPRGGQCAAPLTPVYRFYNNRFAQNDSNHRFTASEVVRDRMIAQGWIDEGIAFCAYGKDTRPVVSLKVSSGDAADIQSIEDCGRETGAARTCVGMRNLPLPSLSYDPPPRSIDFSVQVRDEFNSQSGIHGLGSGYVKNNVGLPAYSRAAAASNTFVQLTTVGDLIGFYLPTRSRGASLYSAITPMLKLPTAAPSPAQDDTRLYPWRDRYGTEYELILFTAAGVHRIDVPPSSHAYGNTMIELIDTTSAKHLRVNVLVYGTVAGSEFAARDAKDGVVIVGAAYREGSPFGRSTRNSTLALARDFSTEYSLGGQFEFRVNRAEFRSVLAAARTVDSGLSARPSDYVVAAFGFNNEVYGDGAVGGFVNGTNLSLVPR